MNKPALKILQHNHIHVIIIEILFFPHFWKSFIFLHVQNSLHFHKADVI